jgi:hypothetical protein
LIKLQISDIPNDVDEKIETVASLYQKYPEIDWRKFLGRRFGNEAFKSDEQRVITYGQMFFGNFTELMKNTPKRYA